MNEEKTPFYKRFDIHVDIEQTKINFVNRVKNLIFELFIDKIMREIEAPECYRFERDIKVYVVSKLGDKYNINQLNLSVYVGENFLKCLLSIESIYEWLKKERIYSRYLNELDSFVKMILKDSEYDLGINWNGSNFNRSGSELLDKILVNDILGVLNNPDKNPIREPFEKGLKEYLQAVSDVDKLKNVVRDMQTSLDETIKYIFKDKNLGFKHLFKDDRHKQIGLDEYFKQIFWNLNEFADKMVKHEGDHSLNKNDVEVFIYITGIFIRRTLVK